MTLQEKELVLLACQEQINNLLQFNEYNSRERALLVERLNAGGRDESDLDEILLHFIEELELIQEQPESLLKAHWFNREALKHIFNQNFRGSLVKALSSEPHLENLLLMLYTKDKLNIELLTSLN